MVWTPGQSLQGGKYIIDRVLGVGGFGITYLATQNRRRHNQKPVVIKTLKDEVRQDPRFANYQTRLQQDFLNEALKLAKCHHPHIVEVQEIIREGDLDCIVMEFVEGESLADCLSKQGILPETEALRYIQQVGEALTLVHERGLLHRDIKPQNIMIRSGTSEAVLIDFGLAREFMQDLIQTHSLALTHGFAPPEQYDRRARRGAYSDVYALAATLYCSLTQHTPPAAFLRLSGTALESPKQLNPGISDRVNKAILKGLELKPGNRPQSMQEWLGLLEEPIARPIAPVRNLPQQSESSYSIPQPSSTEQNRTPIAQPVAPLQSVPRQSVNSMPQRPLGAAQNRTLAKRRSNTIPWISLVFVLAVHITGTLLFVSSTPLWAVAVAAVVVAVAVAVVVGSIVSEINAMPGMQVVSGGLAGVGVATIIMVVFVVAAMVTGEAAVLKAGSLALIVPMAGSLVWAVAGEKLLKSFSPFRTFQILTGISLAGLSLGWLIGILLRSFAS